MTGAAAYGARSVEGHEPGTQIRAVCVVVPVHDEEALLGRCIAGLRHAVHHEQARVGGVRVEVVIVLDGCTDASASIARLSPFRVVEVSERRVGAARATGVEAGLGALRVTYGPLPDQEIWIASTDADSLVPAHWVTSQTGLADRGTDVVVGTVRPDPADLTHRQRAAWQATHVPGRANGHVHGANLGMRADVYAAAGGYPPVDEHEDVALVARARATGARVVASDEAWVLTSGRQQGRTPGGYARYLREDLVGEASA